MAKEYAPFVRKIEIEVENLEMFQEALDAGADIIMLDNMSADMMKKAVEETYDGVRFISHSSHWYDWGCMNYSRFIIDNPPEDKEECIRLHNQVWNAGVRAAIANGGVINDHHGVGLKLGRLMKESYGPAMQVLEGIKKQLDPNGIMNPFKLGL